ncbi:ABC transporter permease [soil metagenome]
MSEGEHGLTASPPLLRSREPQSPERAEIAGTTVLDEIEGPSAFGGSPRRFWDLLWLTALQDFRLEYRTSALGYVWTLLRPLALFGVLYFVFTQIFNYGNGIRDYPLLLLLGIMLFQFFADATAAAMGGMLRGETLIRKMHFPRMVIPLAVVLSAAMTAAMNLAVALVFIIVFGGGIHASWLLLPIPVFALCVFTTGVALLLCTTFVWIRDIGLIWSVVVRTLFYATPILYPLSLVPEKFHTVVALNPLAPILTEAKNLVVHNGSPGLVETIGWPALLGSMAIGLGFCVAGLVLFMRQAPYVAERL